MQLDFHYYGIAVLARAAGFPAAAARTIATASQYVDDATEGERIRLSAGGSEILFDPVRSAYDVLKPRQGLASLDWSVQKRVFLPFHFLPPRAFDPGTASSFSFVTRRASPLAEHLLSEADAEPHPKRRLCRIGVALHTYADTWSHEWFSGRRNCRENDVENLALYHPRLRRWRRPGLEGLLLNALPQIGHAEAGCFPDQSGARWRCTAGDPRCTVERDNGDVFRDAARRIYTRLRAMRKTAAVEGIPWAALEERIGDLLSGGTVAFPGGRRPLSAIRMLEAMAVESLCEAWKARCADLLGGPERFSYDREAWRREALEGDTDWDRWGARDWARDPRRRARPGFWDSPWVHFHRAALHQRHRVLENLP